MSSTIPKRRPWAKLIFNPDVFKDPVEISDERIVIGRAPICGLCFRDNKNISAQHCAIEKSPDGRVYLTDLSGNGTYVNVTERIGRGNRVEIHDGSVIFMVKKKGNPAADLGFTVKLERTHSIIGGTLANVSNTIALQQRSETRVDEIVNSVISSLRPQSSEEGPPAKKSRSTTSRDSTAATSGTASHTVSSTQAINSGATALSVSSSSLIGIVSAGVAASTALLPEATCSSTRPKESGIADNLVCSICFDIIHDCISLQPCMHCFCAGCYSEWMERSELCPDCRVKVERVSKNYVVNNVINAYLAEHPEKKRSDEEIKALDSKNKITPEMLAGKCKTKQRAVNAGGHGPDCVCSDCDDDYSSSSSDESRDDGPPNIVAAVVNALAPQRAYHVPQCRLCVGYRGFPVLNARVRPADPNARPCPAGQPHLMCQCCFANMPDRRQENNPALPPTTCAVCHRAFCDLVFGCSRAGCVGCLAPFKDVTFAAAVYDLIINDNPFETNVLKNYMAKKTITWNDIVRDCVTKMDRGEYYCQDKGAYNLSSDSPLCLTCAQKNFRELVYQYRKDIPQAELPAEVTRRPDCHWGKNCRTQRKPHHAANYNHICEQTKFVP